MDLISLVAVLIAVGLLLWLVNFIPMDARMKQVLNVLVIIAVLLWLLGAFGVLG